MRLVEGVSIMAARMARRIIHKLDRQDSILYRRRFYGGYGEIDNLQLARNLMIDCLLEIERSRLLFSFANWDNSMESLQRLNVRNHIRNNPLSYRNRPEDISPILEHIRNHLIQTFEDIKGLV